MTAVKGRAWTGPRRIYISVHKALEVLMAVGNKIITSVIIVYIWERLSAPYYSVDLGAS
jgi:hypothetical protein